MAKTPTGEADGQRPEALLALGQRVLGGAALADVGHLREEVLRPAVGVAHDGHVQRDPRLAAVGAQVALLGAVGVPLAGGERAHRLAVVVVVGGVGDVAHRHAGQLLGLAAQHRRQRVVDAHEAPVGAGDGHADGGVLEGALEALLGVAQRGGLLVGADGHAELAVDADAAQAPAPAGLGRPEAQRQLERRRARPPAAPATPARRPTRSSGCRKSPTGCAEQLARSARRGAARAPRWRRGWSPRSR